MEWPVEWIDPDVFATWLRERPDASPDLRDDLFLACACVAKVVPAITAFEERYFGEIDRALSRMKPKDLAADELRQRMREKLFVGDGTRPPALRTYGGRGNLTSWFRATVARAVLDHLGAGREVPAEEALFDALVSNEEGTETSHLRAVYRRELREAFAEASERLTHGERNLLRYAFVDGLGVGELAAIYKVHRATAGRKLDDARAAFGGHLRTVMKERLAVSETELLSIVKLVLSSVDLTIQKYLGQKRV